MITWSSVSPTKANQSAPMPFGPWARCRCCCATPFTRTWCNRSKARRHRAWRTIRQYRTGHQHLRRHTAGLKLADYVVTEAGFATDLGAEKFIHIKCRNAGLKPSTVCHCRHGQGDQVPRGFTENRCLGNLAKHIENVRRFGLNPVVCLSHFPDDNPQTMRG